MTSLIAKTVLGFAFLMSVLGLALFVSAGSLRFWQAWVYLAVFAICTFLIVAYLFQNNPSLQASRVQVGPVTETRKSQQYCQKVSYHLVPYIW
jgi:membrane protein implicated in regulation of membrane protease activity